jgi:dimethylhistidine N-methyltransferase
MPLNMPNNMAASAPPCSITPSATTPSATARSTAAPFTAALSTAAIATASAEIQADIIASLQTAHAWTSPKYLYDALGSTLFEAICELPEYYPTRTEAAIFEQHGADMAHAIGRGCTLIDLGAGNCAKAASLFPILLPEQYVALDISYDFLRAALDQLQQRFPQIAMTALGLDFSSQFALPETVRSSARLFFYPGSSIGNFAPDEALAFLQRLRANVSDDGGILIGIDLVKEDAILEAAYDDALGVTAAFNLNLLRHLNHLLGADFNVRQWQHRAFFNSSASRVEMHLEARCDLTVNWQGGHRSFARGERIHTENSYKYTQAAFADLLEQAGFGVTQAWTDANEWYAVMHARPLGA